MGCDHLRSQKVVRPGPDTVVRMVSRARELAYQQTFWKWRPLFTAERTGELDRMVQVDPLLGMTLLTWLGRGATAPTPESVKVEVRKLEFLRGMDAHTIDVSAVPRERRRFLAGIARRAKPATLAG